MLNGMCKLMDNRAKMRRLTALLVRSILNWRELAECQHGRITLIRRRVRAQSPLGQYQSLCFVLLRVSPNVERIRLRGNAMDDAELLFQCRSVGCHNRDTSKNPMTNTSRRRNQTHRNKAWSSLTDFEWVDGEIKKKKNKQKNKQRNLICDFLFFHNHGGWMAKESSV